MPETELDKAKRAIIAEVRQHERNCQYRFIAILWHVAIAIVSCFLLAKAVYGCNPDDFTDTDLYGDGRTTENTDHEN